MSLSGEEKIAQIIGQNITNLLTRQKNPPIGLKWKEIPTANTTDEATMNSNSNNTDDLHKNTVRASGRPKRVPVTRNEDCLWPMSSSKSL
jgi:hypothetical protein